LWTLWSRGRRRLTLAGQVLLLQLLVLATVLVTVGVVSVAQSRADFRSERGARVAGTAEDLAQNPVVREYIDSSRAAQILAPPVVQGQANSGATTVAVVDADGTVLASTDTLAVGDRAVLGNSDVLDGVGWTGDIKQDGQTFLTAHAPVFTDDTRLVGFTVVSEQYPSLATLLREGVPQLLLFLGLGAALGLVGSYLLSRLIRRGTRGLEPSEIATLADHREALLYSIREGVVGIGSDGTVTVLNDGARQLLHLPEDTVGRRLADVDLDPAVRALLLSDGDVVDAVVAVGDRVLVLNRRGASTRGEHIGTVTTLRDRTELVALQSRLAATSSVTQTLRAQSHEFANQLHTIAGLVQLGEYDGVGGFIGELTRRRARISDAVTQAVDDPTVAGLLVAKASLAAEAGVALDVDPGSRLQRLPPDVAADVTTVIGNLVDNALDVSPGGASVRVLLRDEEGVVLVEVADRGPGVPTEMADRIFDRGFSTKPADAAGRGVGLALVQVVCARRGGHVEVGDEAPGGAVFRARIPHDVAQVRR